MLLLNNYEKYFKLGLKILNFYKKNYLLIHININL
jgi:hypothetical protein